MKKEIKKTGFSSSQQKKKKKESSHKKENRKFLVGSKIAHIEWQINIKGSPFFCNGCKKILLSKPGLPKCYVYIDCFALSSPQFNFFSVICDSEFNCSLINFKLCDVCCPKKYPSGIQSAGEFFDELNSLLPTDECIKLL